MAAKVFIPSEGTKKIGGWPKNREIFFIPSEGTKMGPRLEVPTTEASLPDFSFRDFTSERLEGSPELE